jgi:hypothetical protein
MTSQKLYVLVGGYDEGPNDFSTTLANTPEEAIRNLELDPFTWPEDWEYFHNNYPRVRGHQEEEPPKGTMLNPYYTDSREGAIDRVLQFLGIRYKGIKTWNNGNCVDGDSNSLYVLLEIDLGSGAILRLWPPDQGLSYPH